jgi:hypothetical protein
VTPSGQHTRLESPANATAGPFQRATCAGFVRTWGILRAIKSVTHRPVAHISSEVYCSRGAPFSISGVAHVCLGLANVGPRSTKRTFLRIWHFIECSEAGRAPHLENREMRGTPRDVLATQLDCRADVGHPARFRVRFVRTQLREPRTPLSPADASYRTATRQRSSHRLRLSADRHEADLRSLREPGW